MVFWIAMDHHKSYRHWELYAMSKILMIGALIILLGLIFLLLLFCIYAVFRRRVYLQLPIPTPDSSSFPNVDDESGRTGLDAKSVEALPTFLYTESFRKGGKECSVCLSEFENGEKLRLLPKCNHCFHTVCIDMWFHSHNNCPLCRANADADNILLQEEETVNSVNGGDMIIDINNGVHHQEQISRTEIELPLIGQILPEIGLGMSTRSISFSSRGETEDGGSQSFKISRLHSLRRMLSSRSRDGKVFPCDHLQSQGENGGELQD